MFYLGESFEFQNITLEQMNCGGYKVADALKIQEDTVLSKNTAYEKIGKVVMTKVDSNTHCEF